MRAGAGKTGGKASSTAKNAATLTIGNGIAQAIGLAGMALLARLYSPADFGFFAVVTGIATVAASAAPCRYELTILLPRQDRHAQLALWTSLLLAAAVSTALAIVVALVAIATDFEWANYWAEIAALAFSVAAVQTFGYKRNRERRYAHTAWVQIVRAVVMVAASALAWKLDGGLIHGFLAGAVAALLLSLAIEYRVEGRLPGPWSWRRVRGWLRKHDKFMKYSMPAVLINAFAAQLPVFLITIFFGAVAAGFYSFIHRTVMTPITLVSGSLNTVYMQKVTRLSADRRPIHPTVTALIRRLAVFSLLATAAFVVFCLLGGYRFVFGAEWSQLDRLALLMAPTLAVGFVSRCLPGFGVIGRNELGLVYQIALALATFASIYLAWRWWNDLTMMFVAYSAAMTLLYLAQVVSISSISRKKDGALENR